MTYPKAYDPEYGYKYQILIRYPVYNKEWEHCDYAKDRAEKDFLLGEYKLANRGNGAEFKTITLPMKYWGTEIKIGTSSIRKPSSTAGASGRKLSGVTSKRSKEYK